MAKKRINSLGIWRIALEKKLTIAEAVITHLGLDMLGDVSIDSYLMMDCVLK